MSETGKAYYVSARDEMIQRIRLRDQVLMSYIVVVSALLGIALKSHAQTGELFYDTGISYVVALIIPFITLGASVLVATHSHVINTIGRYCYKELVPEIDKCRIRKHGDEYSIIKPWESSQEFSIHGKKIQFVKLIGHGLIMLVPSIFSLLMTHKFFIYPMTFQSLVWIFGFILTALSALVLYNVYKERSKMAEELNSKNKGTS